MLNSSFNIKNHAVFAGHIALYLLYLRKENIANMIKDKLKSILSAFSYRQKVFLLVTGGLIVGLGGLFMYLLRGQS